VPIYFQLKSWIYMVNVRLFPVPIAEATASPHGAGFPKP
jgi:hypothetical protein